jgi:hypothetical protein
MAESAHPTFSSQAEFATSQPKEGSPETEFLQKPDRFFERKFFNRRLRFPDGSEHEMWSFEDDQSGRGFPAPLIRVTEGEMVHVHLKSSKGPHTIHWHGVEPDPRNDGVGHTSFEVTGGYTYQWRAQVGAPGNPNLGSAGSYFYHCHVNTVLHVQMGMVGPMIIDPTVHPDYPVPVGARRPFVDGPLYDIATEASLVPYALDPRWHELGHAAGLSGEDVGLNRFEPKHFFLLGGALAGPGRTGDVWSPTQLLANVVDNGHPTLLRILNLNYFPTRIRFTDAKGKPVVIAELISHDGRAFRDTSSKTGPSPLPRDLGHRIMASQMAFGSAERYEMLLHPRRKGTYMIHVDWIHWATRKILATRSIPLVAA